MNIAQKIILFIGLVFFAFAGVLAIDSWPFLATYAKDYVAEMNVLLKLLITWLVVSIVTAGLIYIFKSKQK